MADKGTTENKGNGSVWGSGFNQWLATNWLFLGVVVAATVWCTNVNFRLAAMQTDLTELKVKLESVEKLSVTDAKFSEGALIYMKEDLRRNFPHAADEIERAYGPLLKEEMN